MKPILPAAVLSLAALGACAPEPPASNYGVGFGDYEAYETARIRREAELTGRVPGTQTGTAPTTNPAQISASELAAAGIPVAAGAPRASAADRVDPVLAGNAAATGTFAAPAPLSSAPLAANGSVAPDPNDPFAVSDEQEFDAVSDRESIESDAARIRANAAQYQVIQPTALPSREGATGPNIVAYALRTTNAPGQPITQRSPGFRASARYETNCSAYASADQAQVDFLARGGPEEDSLGLDPDGDGFACGWDPRPFRTSVGG